MIAAGCMRWSNQPQLGSVVMFSQRGAAPGDCANAGTSATPIGLLVVYQSGVAKSANTPPGPMRRNGRPVSLRTSSMVAVGLATTSSGTRLSLTWMSTPAGAGMTWSRVVRTCGSCSCALTGAAGSRTAASVADRMVRMNLRMNSRIPRVSRSTPV